VCAASSPKTIHDFGGFPKALFSQQYPAPGAPEYAKIVCDLFPANTVTASLDWGLDHGSWTILQSLFPQADIPVFQLSLDVNLNFQEHFNLAKQLASLREQGVIIIGGGNIVHNLARLDMQGNTPDWAVNFDNYIKNALTSGDELALLTIANAGEAANLAVPTDEHFLPLLYIAAVKHGDDTMQFIVDSFDLGSLSMRSVIFQ